MEKIDDIIKLLIENALIADYRLRRIKTKSYENFFVHGKVETVRATDTEDLHVTVYVDGKLDENDKESAENQFRGESSFEIFPYMTKSDILTKIDEAAARARLVKNKPYKIVDGKTMSYEIPSNMKSVEPSVLAKEIAETVFEVKYYKFGSLNAVEIFVYKTEEEIINSRGIDKTQVSWRAMIEAIPTWTENGESVELYECYRFTDFSKEGVTAEIDRRMQEVKDRQIAQKPDTPFTADVLFKSEEIKGFLDEIVNDLSFESVYSHGNVYKKGDSLADSPKGDKLTLTMVKSIKGSPYSGEFDGDGAELKDTLIIDKNKVVGYYGSDRFAQYLGEKPTGNLVCFRLSTGNVGEDFLKDKDYIEVVSMSGIQVDLYNDYIGGEVRLAYYHKGGKVYPISGISLSARISDALNNIYLSNKSDMRDYYEGPEFIYIKDFSVV